MYIYVLLYWYEILICSVVEKKKKNSPYIIKKNRGIFNIRMLLIYILILFPLIIVMGGRNNIGVDTKNYRNIFRAVAINGLDTYKNVEIGYRLLNLCISQFTSNSQWVFVVCATVICSNFCRFFKHTKASVCVMLAIFLGYGYYFYAMNIMRQYFAMSIVLANVYKLEKGENKKFIVDVLFATLFHRSSLIWLVLILVKKFNNKNFYLLTVTIFICARIGMGGLVHFLKYTSYGHFFNTSSYFITKRISYTNVFFSLGILMIYLFMKKETGDVNRIRVKSIWLALLSYLFLNSFGDSIVRMLLGFQIYGSVIIGESILNLHPKVRKIAVLCIVILGFIGMYTILNLKANQVQHFIPYEWGEFI